MKTAHENLGNKFGRLTVLSLSHKDDYRRWHVHVKCDCGTEKVVVFSAISSGGLRSCGCLRDEQAAINSRERCTTHGMAGTPTYRSWQAMIKRCSDLAGNRAHLYVEAGVFVCERWFRFENFLEDMGVRPEGASLDRFPDGKGNYEPGNCRWATAKEQALNRSSTRWFDFEGQMLSLKDLAARVGMKRLTLQMRLKRGWSIDKAINTPVRTDFRNHIIKP